ncbi:hypothetical protein TRFO_27092 [Tritrichomonas foetus]|uniref:SP-RING-type domain-containing protein n=1 Tax=Tritrichomonas foetus TaxID=1144522 RepID=A0A1J4K1B8_9EUKA|nr:hypothetical protein TRFO_27092 [Tritrichomonas foetus]|eukprot:OHT05225.1 hypothetical protein TRFO_27092 [Tritrichomonas foetus]
MTANKKRRVQILRQVRLSDIPENLPKMSIGPSVNSFNSMYSSMNGINLYAYGNNPMTSTTSDSADQSNNISFYSFFDRVAPQNFPRIIVNGIFRDVNEVLKSIITEREPAPPPLTGINNENNDGTSFNYQNNLNLMNESESLNASPTNNDESNTCPISYVPITCPGRGVNCRHEKCFDLRQYLLLCLGENDTCPICNSALRFEDLRFDPTFFSPKLCFDIQMRAPNDEYSLDFLW